MKRFLFACFLSLAFASPASADYAPPDCASDRVPLAVQNWWPDDQKHIHLSVCGPLEKTVSGTVSIPVKITLHNNPGGTINTIFKRIRHATGTKDLTPMTFSNLTCPTGNCTFFKTVSFDTTQAPYDGWAELVVQPKHRVNSVDQIPIVDIPLFLDNPNKTRRDRVWDAGGCGFYGYNYACVGFPSQNVPTAQELMFPGTTPITFTGRFAQAICSDKPGCVQNPVTSYSVHVDPDFHAGNPGTVIASGPISDPTTNHDPGSDKQFTFWPEAFPGTGFRQIVARAIQPDPPGNGGFLDGENEGVAKIYVNDGVA